MKGRTASPAHRVDRRLLRPAAAHRAGVAARARGRVLLIAAPAARAAPLRARAGPAPRVLLVAPAAGRAEAALGVAAALGAAPCATPALAVAARQIVTVRARPNHSVVWSDEMTRATFVDECAMSPPCATKKQERRIPGWYQMSSATSQQPREAAVARQRTMVVCSLSLPSRSFHPNSCGPRGTAHCPACTAPR